MAKSDPLAHIPYPPKSLLFGHTQQVIGDYFGLARRATEEFGDVFRINLLGRWRVAFTSADAVEYILTDPDKLFSSAKGWEDALSQIFPGGLMLRDFDDHRAHRRIMQAAFRKPAMDSYLVLMSAELDSLVADWPTGQPFDFYAAIKELTLRIGARVFVGLPADAAETAQLNDDFIAEVNAAITLIRRPLPLTKFRRGLQGRARLIARFRALVAERRSGDGVDFFSQMCRAQDEDGQFWSDEEIADHFNFLMMAAHDTTASALTTMAWALGTQPDWQERLALEVHHLGDGPMTPDILDQMLQTDAVFKEALRLVPPVALVPRTPLRDFEWNGIKIPAGVPVSANLTMVMRSPELYANPDDFDPERFSDNRAEDRNHRFAFVPFGGGAHKCIGMHFASMQVKAFTRALMRRYVLRAAWDGEKDFTRIPIAKPKGGLPIILRTRLPLSEATPLP